jgi:septum formation protein
MSDFIYLASQSPRRSQLLDQLGVAHTLLLPGPDDDAEALEHVRGSEAPARYVARVTGLKLDAAVERMRRQDLREAPVLCADTTVCLGRDILGKPVDEADAVRILKLLSGQSHRVLTAVAAQKGQKRLSEVSESWVRFAPMTIVQIKAYAATGEPMGKAGAYGVQGKAAAHIEQIRGSYSGIMGLPLYETAAVLCALGVRC